MRPSSSIVVAFLIACAGAKEPAQPRGTQSVAIDSCTRDDECVALRGDACNPCGGCPSQEPVAMSSRHLEAIKSEPACRERLRPNEPPPNCSPCGGEAVLPNSQAACVSGRCALRCFEIKTDGPAWPPVEKPCVR